MEFVLGFYLVGAVLISIFLVASTWTRPLEGFGVWETCFMMILTTIIWPVFVGHALYNKYVNRNL